MSETMASTVERIRRLEVQGARNVAIAAIKAIETLSNETKARNRRQFLGELNQAKDALSSSRVTEPLMRNAVQWIVNEVKKSQEKRIGKLAGIVSVASQRFLKDLEGSVSKIAEIGARRIRDGSVVLTHCHSSTVTSLFEAAKRKGKSFEVICTESRPMFQGRTTAKEMLDLGVKTTVIVDSAARFFMNDVDLVMVGADAITSEGNVINKIGTSTVALVAREARTPFYVVSELLKFDAATMCGDYEKIEERNPHEVWKDPPRNLTVRNPAFDVTRRDFIHGIVCEEGIVSPHCIVDVVRRRYPWILK